MKEAEALMSSTGKLRERLVHCIVCIWQSRMFVYKRVLRIYRSPEPQLTHSQFLFPVWQRGISGFFSTLGDSNPNPQPNITP